MACSSNDNTGTGAQSAPSPTSPVVKTHSRFYMPGGDLLILVKKPTLTYFRISSYFVLDSDFLKIKSVSESRDEAPQPGMEPAIIVEEHEATVDDMASLCWVFLNPLYDDYSRATLTEWFSILKLAFLWNFPSIKKLALKYINRMIDSEVPSLVERILKFEENVPLPEALTPLYVELCTRDAGLTDQEWDLLEGLPGKRIRRVVELREKITKLKSSGNAKPSEAQGKLEKNIAHTLGFIEKAVPSCSGATDKVHQHNGISSTTPGRANGSGPHKDDATTTSTTTATGTPTTTSGTSGTSAWNRNP